MRLICLNHGSGKLWINLANVTAVEFTIFERADAARVYTLRGEWLIRDADSLRILRAELENLSTFR
jgi:hypothetical protein